MMPMKSGEDQTWWNIYIQTMPSFYVYTFLDKRTGKHCTKISHLSSIMRHESLELVSIRVPNEASTLLKAEVALASKANQEAFYIINSN